MMSMGGNDISRYHSKWTLNCDFCGKRFNSRKEDFKVGEFDIIFCKSCYVDSMAKRDTKKEAKILQGRKYKWLGDQLDEGVKKQIAKSLKKDRSNPPRWTQKSFDRRGQRQS